MTQKDKKELSDKEKKRIHNLYKSNTKKYMSWLWKEFKLYDVECSVEFKDRVFLPHEQIKDSEDELIEGATGALSACVAYDTRYLTAHFIFSYEGCENYTEQEHFDICLHECIHVLTGDIGSFVRAIITSSDDFGAMIGNFHTEADERLTTKLTRILSPLLWDKYQDKNQDKKGK